MIRALILAALLGGCATQQPPPFDVSRSDPVCARGCLSKHSDCVSQAGLSIGPATSQRVLQACRMTADSCLSTCPKK